MYAVSWSCNGNKNVDRLIHNDIDLFFDVPKINEIAASLASVSGTQNYSSVKY